MAIKPILTFYLPKFSWYIYLLGIFAFYSEEYFARSYIGTFLERVCEIKKTRVKLAAGGQPPSAAKTIINEL